MVYFEAAFHLLANNPGKAASQCKSLPFLYKPFAALTSGVCPFNKTHMAFTGGTIVTLSTNQIVRLLDAVTLDYNLPEDSVKTLLFEIAVQDPEAL